MRSIASIESKRFLGSYYYSKNNLPIPEWLKISAGVTLGFVLLPLLFCIGWGELLPFIWMMTIDGLSGLLGFILYKMSSNVVSSCVPIDRIPRIPSSAGNGNKLRKAA